MCCLLSLPVATKYIRTGFHIHGRGFHIHVDPEANIQGTRKHLVPPPFLIGRCRSRLGRQHFPPWLDNSIVLREIDPLPFRLHSHRAFHLTVFEALGQNVLGVMFDKAPLNPERLILIEMEVDVTAEPLDLVEQFRLFALTVTVSCLHNQIQPLP